MSYTEADLKNWILKRIGDAEKKGNFLTQKFLMQSAVGKYHCTAKESFKVISELLIEGSLIEEISEDKVIVKRVI